jgi:hypothetical protein
MQRCLNQHKFPSKFLHLDFLNNKIHIYFQSNSANCFVASQALFHKLFINHVIEHNYIN